MRCTNCRKTALAPSHYDGSKAGTVVALRYTGQSVGAQAVTAPSGRQYIFSALQPDIVVDGGDAKALVSLGCFEKG